MYVKMYLDSIDYRYVLHTCVDCVTKVEQISDIVHVECDSVPLCVPRKQFD